MGGYSEIKKFSFPDGCRCSAKCANFTLGNTFLHALTVTVLRSVAGQRKGLSETYVIETPLLQV